jgi:hypothetical protein
MAWPTQTVKNWQQFEELVSSRGFGGNPLKVGFLHRGQSNSAWALKTSLGRTLKAGIVVVDALSLENDLVRLFRSQAHIHLRAEFLPDGDDVLEWWQVMQHYGAPTRLLDWTASAFVAAYFAVVENWETDGAIWTVHPMTLHNAAAKLLKAPLEQVVQQANAPSAVMPMSMARHSDRTVAQQGAFTIALHVLGDQEALIDTVAAPEEKEGFTYCKFVIPKSLKPEFLKRLHSMNVSAASLFPGHDGLGRSLSELARLGAR